MRDSIRLENSKIYVSKSVSKTYFIVANRISNGDSNNKNSAFLAYCKAAFTRQTNVGQLVLANSS